MWYYSENGNRLGPVTADDMAMLFSNGTVDGNTLVWNAAMTDWVPASKTDLAPLFATGSPPPLTGDAVKNTWVWWLAFAPLIGGFLEVVLRSFFAALPSAPGVSQTSFWWVTLAINIGLCVGDQGALKRAGHDTRRMGSPWIIPVYLFKRATYLKQGNGYAIAWLISFALSIALNAT